MPRSDAFKAEVAALRAELRDDTAVVATPRPRLSWQVRTDEPGWVQESALISAGDEEVRIDGRDSVFVPWPFAELAPGEDREVRVRVRAVSGTETEWSEPIHARAGFLAEGEWVAQPVGLADPTSEAQPFLVRTTFEVDGPVRRATLFWTALGVAEPELNGAAVSDDVLSPGWTAYRDRLVHETVDVTGLLAPGTNVLGATVAGCWYTEKWGYYGRATRTYGQQPSWFGSSTPTAAWRPWRRPVPRGVHPETGPWSPVACTPVNIKT